jgi:tRNA 2-thiocytidine biosynthesis protein TtcA
MDASNGDRLGINLVKRINKAARDFGLFEEGDRIAVAVSGGKDSLSLLRLLSLRQPSAREDYELVALHVRGLPGATHSSGADIGDDTAVLEEWLETSGSAYQILDVDVPADEPRPLSCFRCSWHRRKALFLAAHKLGCNKLAFGHHADDVAQTTLLNLFYHGRIETMEPRVSFFDGTITVIRPLYYVPKKELIRYARACDFPLTQGCCPQAESSRRQKMHEVLRMVERDMPRAKVNLLRAVQRCNG